MSMVLNNGFFDYFSLHFRFVWDREFHCFASIDWLYKSIMLLCGWGRRICHMWREWYNRVNNWLNAFLDDSDTSRHYRHYMTIWPWSLTFDLWVLKFHHRIHVSWQIVANIYCKLLLTVFEFLTFHCRVKLDTSVRWMGRKSDRQTAFLNGRLVGNILIYAAVTILTVWYSVVIVFLWSVILLQWWYNLTI